MHSAPIADSLGSFSSGGDSAETFTGVTLLNRARAWFFITEMTERCAESRRSARWLQLFTGPNAPARHTYRHRTAALMVSLLLKLLHGLMFQSIRSRSCWPRAGSQARRSGEYGMSPQMP